MGRSCRPRWLHNHGGRQADARCRRDAGGLCLSARLAALAAVALHGQGTGDPAWRAVPRRDRTPAARRRLRPGGGIAATVCRAPGGAVSALQREADRCAEPDARRDGRGRPSRAADHAGGGGLRALDRLRERRQPGADRRARAAARAGRAHGARRRPRTPGPGPARRERVARGDWRSERAARRAVGHAPHRRARCRGRHPAAGPDPPRSARGGLHGGGIGAVGGALRNPSGLARGAASRHHARHQGRRRLDGGRSRSPAPPRRSHRARSRAVGGAADRRRAADALVPRPHGRRPRLRSVTDPDVQPVASAHHLSDAGVPRHSRGGPDQRDRRARGRRSGSGDLRPAAVRLQLHHLDFDDRRPDAGPRRPDAAQHAGPRGDGGVLPRHGHPDARRADVPACRRQWRPSSHRREPGGGRRAVAGYRAARPEHDARHPAGAGRGTRGRHRDRPRRQRARPRPWRTVPPDGVPCARAVPGGVHQRRGQGPR